MGNSGPCGRFAVVRLVEGWERKSKVGAFQSHTQKIKSSKGHGSFNAILSYTL